MNLGYTKLLSIFFCFNLFLTLSFSQNQISGIINKYSAVKTIDYCKNGVIVDNPLDYQTGQKVILVQMKGAFIDSRNEPSFGRIIDARSSGKYEKASIRAINGDTIFFQNTIINRYDIPEKVQMVSMPTFDNVSVSDTVKALPWDGNKGGIIALSVSGTLTLNAPIVASEAGFRGGKTLSPQNECTGGLNNASRFFAIKVGSWQAAAKGEGIAEFVAEAEHGKGPQANGGGGGNDHNAGGAGGSHISRGGDGGRRESPIFSLVCRGDNPGLKGNSLADDATRVYFGGGGGAGHTNNETNKDGGNGGGIVIVEATNIVGNNQVIATNGGSAKEVKGDGGSGGGAGGSIILLTDNVSSNLRLEAKGGNGARANNENTDNCFGPGGGGSGGRLLTNLSGFEPVVFSLEGGSAGQSIGSTIGSCSNTTNGAGNGEQGIGTGLSKLVEGTSPIVLPSIVRQPQEIIGCIGQNINVNVETMGAGLTYQWQINTGNGFTNLMNNATYDNTATSTLRINNVTPDMENSQFQLRITSACFGAITSSPISIKLGPNAPVADFSFERRSNGIVIFTNQAQFGDNFLWEFGDGVRSPSTNTSHTFPAEGTYSVSLIASNQCGTDTITKNITIVLPPQAGFNANGTVGCAPLAILFSNTSSQNTASYRWLFEGGNPSSSTEANPRVTYDSVGVFDVALIVINEAGSDTLLRQEYVNIESVPDPGFLTDVNDLFVKFTNTTIDGTNYRWDFGDNTPTNTLPNPEHTYPELGTYEVTLIATNNCGENSFTQKIAVGSAPLALFGADNNVGCAPITIQFIDQSKGTVSEWEWEFESGQPATSTERNPTITYNEAGEYNVYLRVVNELGQDTSLRRKFIKLAEPPVADFDFSIKDGVVSFDNRSEGASQYGWIFGDGGISDQINPRHTYSRGGIYYVTLNAFNRFCGAVVTIPVNIILTSTEQLENGDVVKFYPNPVTDWFNVEVEQIFPSEVSFKLFDWTGKVVKFDTFYTNTAFQANLSELTPGAYIVQINSKDWQLTERIIKQ